MPTQSQHDPAAAQDVQKVMQQPLMPRNQAREIINSSLPVHEEVLQLCTGSLAGLTARLVQARAAERQQVRHVSIFLKVSFNQRSGEVVRQKLLALRDCGEAAGAVEVSGRRLEIRILHLTK
jgi:hypothetical protein